LPLFLFCFDRASLISKTTSPSLISVLPSFLFVVFPSS
jgi:hypothetical protein